MTEAQYAHCQFRNLPMSVIGRTLCLTGIMLTYAKAHVSAVLQQYSISIQNVEFDAQALFRILVLEV